MFIQNFVEGESIGIRLAFYLIKPTWKIFNAFYGCLVQCFGWSLLDAFPQRIGHLLYGVAGLHGSLINSRSISARNHIKHEVCCSALETVALAPHFFLENTYSLSSFPRCMCMHDYLRRPIFQPISFNSAAYSTRKFTSLISFYRPFH